MKIIIRNIDVKAKLKKHYPWEASDDQDISINVTISVDSFGRERCLSDTIDYVKIEEIILDIVTNNRFEIIEDLGNTICNKILDFNRKILDVETTICKRNVMKVAAEVAVCMSKKRDAPEKVIVCLGSNIGDRLQNIISAAKILKNYLSEFAISGIYESDACLAEGSPAEWNMPFLNCAVSGYFHKNYDDLYLITSAAEQKLGKKANKMKDEPREIDIDILYYGGKIISTHDLQVPHSRCYYRDFMLFPAAEIEPNIIFTNISNNTKLFVKKSDIIL